MRSRFVPSLSHFLCSPSEHHIDGVHFALEYHAVHQAQDGSLLVVGILLDFDNTGSPFFQSLIGRVSLLRERNECIVKCWNSNTTRIIQKISSSS